MGTAAGTWSPWDSLHGGQRIIAGGGDPVGEELSNKQPTSQVKRRLPSKPCAELRGGSRFEVSLPAFHV